MSALDHTEIEEKNIMKALIDERFFEAHRSSCVQLDRMFAWIFVLQWVVAIMVASLLAPYTWEATTRSIHPHVWAAVLLGGMVSSLPIYLCWKRSGEVYTRMVVGIGLTMMTALLIHITWGRIETHFHAFVALAVLSFYREKRLLLVAAGIVFADHLIRGALWPASVFGAGTADPLLRSLEHTGWVLGEVIFLCFSIDRSRLEMRKIISHEVEVEQLGCKLEQKVEHRTAQLKESEAKSRSLFENAVVGLFRCDPCGKLVEANPAITRMLGYRSTEGLLSEVKCIDGIEVGEAGKRTCYSRAADGEGITLECCEWKNKRGDRIPVRVSAKPVYDENNQLLYIEGFAEDISDNRALEATVQERTQSLLRAKDELEKERASLAKRVDDRTAELKRANHQLTESARMKDEFLANMSHELRTPLNSILGLSEAFIEGIYGGLTAKQTQKIQNIETSGRHLLDLINEVLDVAKLGAGEMKLSVGTVEVPALVHSCTSFVTVQATRKGLGLTCEVDPEVGEIRADGQKLKQILVNLLSNAVKFTNKGGVRLEVKSQAQDGFIHFLVSDTGIGIADQDLDQLFTPFVQLDSGLTREHSGTGLGLALVKQMVDLHGGTVAVTSNPGTGSTFTISIPKVQPDDIEEGLMPIQPGTELSDIQSAFVIEDSDVAAEQIARYLSEREIGCSICDSGEKALSQLEEDVPDLIVLDIQLPGIWGWSVLDNLKASPRTRNIPVIIVSIDDDRRKGLSLGASDYLVKPVTRMEMNEALDRLTASNESRLTKAIVAKQPAVPSRRRHQILIADDSDGNIETLSDFLLAQGYHLMIARDGQEALDRCRSSRPDLVLMDVQMPRLDGLTAIAEMKSDPGLSDIPVIAITARAMEGDQELCLRAGAIDYVSKPIHFGGLLEKLETIFDDSTAPAILLS